MKVQFVLLILFLFTGYSTLAQDTLNQVPDEINELLYRRLESIRYPNVSRSLIKSGTCVLVFKKSKEWEADILNSLGPDFDHSIKIGIEKVKKEIEYDGSFVVFIPLTFVASGFQYVRTELPEVLSTEIRILGSKSHKSRFSLEQLLADYQQEFRNGNYSKSLRYLDNLILLDPFKPKYRTDRMRLMELLGDKQAGCEDYNVLKYLIRYASTPSSPCLNESG